MRKKIIAGNWKMYKTQKETEEYFSKLLSFLNTGEKEVVIFPTYLSLNKAVELTRNSFVKIGAQNMHFADEGAYTGEVSADMIKETGAEYVLIGHSERRKYFAESDEAVNLKAKKALEKGLLPMVCVGEDLSERESGCTFKVLERQVKEGLADINDERLVVAYEPVWAIGTGKTATDEQAEEACAFIRKCISEMFGETAEHIRILYGGSVKPSNAAGLLTKDNIDGALVGGASLKEDFVEILNYDK